MSHSRTEHSFPFHIGKKFPSLPPFPLSVLHQEYLQAVLQDNGEQLPRAKGTVALTNVVFTEKETLCSHIRVKYLLFISAKASERKEQKGKGSQKGEREKVRAIKTGGERESERARERDGEISRGLWRHCETFHDNRTGGF